MKKLMTTLTTALIAGSAFATPTIYPTDVTLLSNIKNPTNSNLVADDADQHVIWVMPPNTAYSKVGNLHTITSNIGFCQEMANIQSYSLSLTASLKTMQDKSTASQDKLEAIQLKLNNARQELAQYKTSNNLQEFTTIDDRLAIVEEQISGLTDKLNSCGDHCSEVSVQLSELRSERSELVKQRRDLSKDRAAAVRMMDKKQAAVNAYEVEFSEAEQQFTKISEDILRTRNSLLGMYKEFAKMEGARAAVSFESDWDKNIQELENNNPNFVFKQIQTEKAHVSTSLMAGNSLPGDSAVLAYEISGKSVSGGIEFSAYPPSFSANLRLSLIGACPMLHKDLFNIPVENGTDQMKYGMIVSYEYPTSVEASLHIEYYMYKMYQKIVKSKTKGGFFSSSKKTSVTEKNFFREEFITTWREQDSTYKYTDEEKADIEKEIRDDMFARMAANALPVIPNPGTLIAESAPANGAAVLGASLAKNKACRANQWCTAATIGVNVLNAVFGGSSSAASYTNIQDIKQEVDWTRKQVVMKPWISSYR